MVISQEDYENASSRASYWSRRAPIRLSRDVTIGLITTCSNRERAVWGSAGGKALLILIIGRSKCRYLSRVRLRR
jgi:hypothetical protein